MTLLVKAAREGQTIARVTPATAGWHYVGFAAYRLAESDVVLVEGAGGLMSPLGEEEYVADLAYDLGFPLVVVARNALGTINHVLQTLITAATFRDGLDVAGIVLNRNTEVTDQSAQQNAAEIRRRAVAPLLAELGFGAPAFEPAVDWHALAKSPVRAGNQAIHDRATQ